MEKFYAINKHTQTMMFAGLQTQKTLFFKKRKSAEKWKKENEQFYSNGISDIWITEEELLN